MIKRTLAAVAVSSTLVVAVPTAAQAMAPDAPRAGGPGFNGLVQSVVHRGDTVYVAGDFTSVTSNGKSLARDGVAAVSSSTGAVLPWSPTVDGRVNGLAVAKEGVYLVGDFSAVDGQKRRDVARVDRVTGKVDPLFKHGTNGVVNAVALSKYKVYLGGEFTRFDGRDRGQLAAVTRRGTSVIRQWRPSTTNGAVTDLVRKSSGVYVGGFFHQINGKDRQFLALVTKRRGALVKSFASEVPNVVLDLSVTKDRVYAGTGGVNMGGGAVAIRRKDGSRAWQRRLDGDVQAVTTMHGTIYLGGHFKTICKWGAAQDSTGTCTGGVSATRYRGASLDRDGHVTSWNPQVNVKISDIPGIEALARFRGRDAVVAVGGFSTVHDVDALRYAYFD